MKKHVVLCCVGVLILPLALAIEATAGSGWYLLRPPVTSSTETGPYHVGYDKPLSKWSQQGAYDSAAECEAARSNGEREAKKVAERDSKGGPLTATFVAALQAVCVASDDPRLVKVQGPSSGWVLWANTFSPTYFWYPGSAYEDEATCEAARVQAKKNALRAGYAEAGGEVLEKASSQMRWVCLPDTVKPQ